GIRPREICDDGGRRPALRWKRERRAAGRDARQTAFPDGLSAGAAEAIDIRLVIEKQLPVRKEDRLPYARGFQQEISLARRGIGGEHASAALDHAAHRAHFAWTCARAAAECRAVEKPAP